MNNFIIENNILYEYFGDDKIVKIPDGVTTIKKNAFTNALVEEVIIPEGVIALDDYSFSNCSELRRVTFPSSLRKIGHKAFGSCNHLTVDFSALSDSIEIDPSAFEGSCTHTFTIEYTINNKHVKDELEIEFYAGQTLDDVIDNYIKNYIYDISDFDDILNEAISQGNATMDERGIYDVWKVSDAIHTAADLFLDDKKNELTFIIMDDYSHLGTTEAVPYDIIKLLKTRLECLDEAEYVYIGCAIENDFYDFIENGVWHYGLVSSTELLCEPRTWPEPLYINNAVVWKHGNEELKPAIWYGRQNDHIMERWTISTESDMEDFHFWFIDDNNSEEIMDSVVFDFNDISYWYLYEYGNIVPDLSKAIKRCPIHFEETESKDQITKKLNTFFLTVYNTIHNTKENQLKGKNNIKEKLLQNWEEIPEQFEQLKLDL